MSETFVDIMRTELYQSSSNVHKMHYTSNTASQKLITQFKTSKSSIVVFKCVTLFLSPLNFLVRCLIELNVSSERFLAARNPDRIIFPTRKSHLLPRHLQNIKIRYEKKKIMKIMTNENILKI